MICLDSNRLKNQREIVDKTMATPCTVQQNYNICVKCLTINQRLAVQLTDDFHVVLVLPQPNNKANSAIHMVLSLLDIWPESSL